MPMSIPIFLYGAVCDKCKESSAFDLTVEYTMPDLTHFCDRRELSPIVNDDEGFKIVSTCQSCNAEHKLVGAKDNLVGNHHWAKEYFVDDEQRSITRLLHLPQCPFCQSATHATISLYMADLRSKVLGVPSFYVDLQAVCNGCGMTGPVTHWRDPMAITDNSGNSPWMSYAEIAEEEARLKSYVDELGQSPEGQLGMLLSDLQDLIDKYDDESEGCECIDEYPDDRLYLDENGEW